MKILKILFLSVLFVSIAHAEKINVKRANKLKGGLFEGVKINKLIGNVLMEHKSTLLYCDSAYQYLNKDEVVAFGKVRLVHHDSIVATGRKLVYNGETRIAILTGDIVTLTDPSMKLTTDYLVYDLNANTGTYTTGGVVESDGAILKSKYGKYLASSSLYQFKKNIDLVKDDYHVISDTLHYSVSTQKVFFFGPTHITSNKECIYAKRGTYVFNSELTHLFGDAIVENNEYSLRGEEINFNNELGDGYAKGKVVISYPKDSTTIYGNYAKRIGQEFKTKVYGNPLLQKVINADTFHLVADTLVSINDSLQGKNDIFAFRNVKVFKQELQAVSDSIHYSLEDSSITFFKNPIVWNQENQVTADTIIAYLKNGELDHMYVNHKAYLISHEEGGNYNQLQGKTMLAKFIDGNISTVDVNGNGTSLYFANDEKTKELMGMNRVICSNMLISFEQNELKDIMFRTKPESKFIPPHILAEPDKRLKGFKWFESVRPSKSIVGDRNNFLN